MKERQRQLHEEREEQKAVLQRLHQEQEYHVQEVLKLDTIV